MKNLLKNNLIVFLLIVIVQVAYKVLYLDEWGFWHDEAFSLYYSQQHWGHLKHISEWDINPPLYYYFLWIWQNLFGISEYAIRFSSVIFSALSAGMLFLLCAKHFNRNTGWLAVLFFSICNEMYFYAHEARPYSLIIFLVLCSTYVFFELIQKPGWILAILLAFLNFGLIYTHYVCGIIIGFQALIVLSLRSKALFKFMGTALGLTVLLAALRFTKKTVAMVLHNEKSSFWIEKPTMRDLLDTLYAFFNGHDLFWIFTFAALVAVVHLMRAGEWKAIRSAHSAKFNYVLLAGFGSLLICFLISLFMPLFVRRYLLFAGPFLYIALAWLISYVDKGIAFPLLAIISVFMIFSFMRIDLHTPRSMDYRNAVVTVKALQRNNTPVLVETPDVGAMFSYYYDRDIFKDYGNIDGRLKDKNVFFVANENDASAVDLSKYDRIVLTQTFEDVNPGDKGLMKLLTEKYPYKVVSRRYRGITITLFGK